ncbi:MAG: transposase [bacterium]
MTDTTHIYRSIVLPHIDFPGAIQFVTTRLADSFPTGWNAHTSLPSTATPLEIRRAFEGRLDQGHGACWLADPRVARIVQDSLRHFDGQHYDLFAWVLMPNHAHCLLRPRPGFSLSKIVARWKGYTALEANRILGRQGAFWQRDYFDRYIRDERQFYGAVEYIHRNPFKAGRVARPELWEWSSAQAWLTDPDRFVHLLGQTEG